MSTQGQDRCTTYRCTWCGWETERTEGDPWPACVNCFWEFHFALGLLPRTLMLPTDQFGADELPGAARKRFVFKDRDGRDVWTTLPPVAKSA